MFDLEGLDVEAVGLGREDQEGHHRHVGSSKSRSRVF